jgi:hypothetical protein
MRRAEMFVMLVRSGHMPKGNRLSWSRSMMRTTARYRLAATAFSDATFAAAG